MNIKSVICVSCLVGAAILLCKPEIANFKFSKNNNQVKETRTTVEKIKHENPFYNVSNEYKNRDGIVEFAVNYPPSLSYKSKYEIFKMRKRYVYDSIFDNINYEPSDIVFGQIEDKKPWMSLDICRDKSTDKIKITGASEEARWIANPTMLVALEHAYYYPYSDDYNFCNSLDTTMVPEKISYDPQKNEITVKYESLPFTTKGDSSFYDINGVNARDLGYKFIYVDKSKSTYDIKFINPENAGNQVVEFQNFIHLGSSCGHEGGCNNGSPRQPLLEFKADMDDYTQTDKEIYIKLWHNRPQSPDSPADITERIILGRT